MAGERERAEGVEPWPHLAPFAADGLPFAPRRRRMPLARAQEVAYA